MTVAAVSVVAAVAAVASYVHLHALATEAGEGWRAVLIPLSVDGLLVAASMVLLVRRRAGESAGVLPWVGMVLGLVASLAANVAAAEPTVLSWIVSGWPPVALAVSFELLIQVSREKGVHSLDTPGQGSPAIAGARNLAPEDLAGVRKVPGAGKVSAGQEGASIEAPSRSQEAASIEAASPATASIEAVTPSPAELIASGMGRRKLAAELGIPENQARQLIAQHRTNGHDVAGDAG